MLEVRSSEWDLGWTAFYTSAMDTHRERHMQTPEHKYTQTHTHTHATHEHPLCRTGIGPEFDKPTPAGK